MYRVFDLLNGSRVSRQYVEQALAQGVMAIHVTVNNFSTIRPYPTLHEALSELAAIRAHYAALDSVTVIEKFSDFVKARQTGRLGIILGYQNVPSIGGDLKMLELFHALGVRVIQIAHNNGGPFAGGCADPADSGLTPLGRDLVFELNRLGIVVDLSHTGEKSSIDAIRLSQAPICITHANAFAVCQNVRNKSDAVLDVLKENGGVIGVCYLTPLVRGGGAKPTHADLRAHVKYICDRIGAEHIGLGSDFIEDQPSERYHEFLRKPEVYGTWPWRFPVTDLADQQRFLESLGAIGLSDQQIQGVAGDNFLRVFEKIIS